MQEADPKTPTLKDFLGTREQGRFNRISSLSSFLKHQRVLSTDTLKQEDFSSPALPKMSLNGEMDVSGPSEIEDNSLPPPPPPKDDTGWGAAALPAPEKQLPLIYEPSSTPAPQPPRLKKKVPWKGKNIMVLLPRDDERGRRGKAPAPMREKEVVAMLRDWESLGYDTTGFNLGNNVEEEGTEGQSRSVWPNVEHLNQERAQRDYKVSIPDKKEWDAYVRELSEAKLRALGVSFGDEDPPAISPVPSAVSRRMSTHVYPQLPFSPPLPTSSASSSRANHHPFSPPLVTGVGPSASQSSINGSIASPVSMQSASQFKFNPRQSVSFTSGGHPFGSPFEYGQQSPSFSPGHHYSQTMSFARGGSPNLQNLGSMISPSSPFQQGYFPDDPMTQLQQRQQIQFRTSATASPRLQELKETDEEVREPSKSPSKTPEARVQRHNPSASLQKEIDDAEYHLEKQFQRQLEHEDYSPHSDHGEDGEKPVAESDDHNLNKPSVHNIGGLQSSRYASDSDGPILHHPQPHSRGHSLSQRPFQDGDDTSSGDGASQPKLLRTVSEALTNLSDVETNPSNLGTPIPSQEFGSSGHDRSFSTASNPWVDSDSQNKKVTRPSHVSKPSLGLNVAAKEFKFEPSNSISFKPGAFSFTGSSTFSPSASGFAPNVPTSATSSHFSHRSTGSKINVAAPVFTPGHSEFNFSSSGPSFRPDAPAFTPLHFSDFGSSSDGPQSGSIFGKIDLSHIGITKPSKKSKAIPIVRPDSSHNSAAHETMEGNDGRITQGEGRIKRARGGKDDGDSVALFAEPSMPLGETSREQSPPKESPPAAQLRPALAQADKENSEPLESTEEEHLTEEEHIKSFKFPKPQPFEDNEDHEKAFSPFTFQQQKDAEDFNAARPFDTTHVLEKSKSGLQPYGLGLPASPEQPKAVPTPEKPKMHRKNTSSLSATAKPFEFRPGSFTFRTEAELSQPEPIVAPHFSLPKAGLSSSRYANSPSPPAKVSPPVVLHTEEYPAFQAGLPQHESPLTYPGDATPDREPTFEEIDAVMRQLNENEMDSASHIPPPRFHQPSPVRPNPITVPVNYSSPVRLEPQNIMRSDAPSPSPQRFPRGLPPNVDLASQRVFSRPATEDPFVGESASALQFPSSPIRRLNTTESLPQSDWDDVISETEEAKIHPRAGFFDNHVNDLVGGLLEERLDPLERALEAIQLSLETMATVPSRRRDGRSVSLELPSDADDEDDEHPPRRSLSPQRNRKMEKIRAIVSETLAQHRLSSRPQSSAAPLPPPDNSNVLKVLEDMKESFGQSLRLDLRGEDLRNIVEQAVEARMPATPQPDEPAIKREDFRSIVEQAIEAHMPATLQPDEAAIKKYEEQQARIIDLEEILRRADLKIEDQIKERRAAEDRLAEVQRLLRISSEEETRLREALDERDEKIRNVIEERDQKVRSIEESRGKAAMRIALLEAAQNNSQKTSSDLHNRLAMTEDDLRDANEKVSRWQLETERALEAAKRHSDDAEMANETNKDLRRTIETLRSQMEESIRVREGMRGKLMGLQEDMAKAAREISEENARRAKKEAELVARQEVLDAKLQAEARTRERLEMEIERLEAGERQGMRAVSDCKKLEALVDELRTESHVAKKDAMRYQREYEEAREAGLSEVQRTRNYMQTEIDSANNQVNVVRDELETQLARARSEIDQIKLDADTAKARHEMLLEEVTASRIAILEDLTNKHANEVEDIHTQHERQLNNAIEDAQRSEQHLLERLSLSSAKTEHLQDRVSHLEEKLEIAKAAAHAAAQHARSDRAVSGSSVATTPLTAQHQPLVVPKRDPRMDLPEKISPQALRESIMVLQEQLQDREQKIEKLEQTLSTVDPDAPTKIAKRDDEIMWLRELLAVRKGDLQDIVNSLATDNFNAESVKDAAIRLNANIQMEEQERERAMNGGSSLNLPNIAASLAASPRVAQAVGPLAAAWGNWRKSRDPNLATETASSTPLAKSNPRSSGLLSGLLTPPATVRTPGGAQPSAFASTGQRFTAEQLANRPRSMTPRKQGKQPMRGSPRRSGPPATPPMMRKSSYDMDAQEGSSENFGFDDDDESTADESFANLGR